MNRFLLTRLVVLLAFGLGAALPASAQQFNGFYCQLDIEEAGEVPEGVEGLQTTTDSKKVCTGGRVPNILLECRKQIDGWTGGAFEAVGIPCQVNGKQCGLEGFFDEPLESSLEINPRGRALLKCQFQPS